MDGLIQWLAASKASLLIQNNIWLVETLQTIHILAVCVVMASVLLLNLRLVGVIDGGEAMAAFTRRYVPWVAAALPVLLLTGSILIVGEPNRDLNNWVFWTKMSLLVGAVLLTIVLERPIYARPDYWASRRPAAKLLAIVALCLWVGIVFCGRWIAYSFTN